MIGYDSGKEQKAAIVSGEMAGAITQNPVGIGDCTVDSAVKALKGEKLPKVIDTGFYWYDKTNIDRSEDRRGALRLRSVRPGGSPAAGPTPSFPGQTTPKRRAPPPRAESEEERGRKGGGAAHGVGITFNQKPCFFRTPQHRPAQPRDRRPSRLVSRRIIAG